MPIPPDPALVERFRRDLASLSVPDDERLALAVSGGPDSIAMLALAAAAFPGQIIAATVDHRLRAESATEAEAVVQSCAELGVDHATLVIETPPGASGNLQAWARQERYLLLKRWAIDNDAPFLCTAHHAEDQAETFLMRAARASGLSGLAAIRARTDDSVALREFSGIEQVAEGAIISVYRRDIVLLRPLLRWRRHELRSVAEASSLAFFDDPSNADPTFDRTRFRSWLESAPWISPLSIARSAEHLAETDADLVSVSHWLLTERSLPAGDYEARLDVADLPRGVRRYIARMVIADVQLQRSGQADTRSIEPLLDALEAGRGATHAGVQASAKGTIWHFREAPPRRPTSPRNAPPDPSP